MENPIKMMLRPRVSVCLTLVSLATAIIPQTGLAQIYRQFQVTSLDTNLTGVTATTLGPDRHLYVATVQGNVYRYQIDHATGLPVGTRELLFDSPVSELNIGLEFDPSATADNLVVWNTHSPIGTGTKFRGTLSKMVLSPAGDPVTLATRQNYIVGMQTDDNDHVVNQMDFGPDGRLYFGLGSDGKSANFGLLGASILVADVNDPNFLVGGQPVNANTDQGYDPYAPDAKLQFYATGTRNAYDLVWHSNGYLYAPLNGNDGSGDAVDNPNTPRNEAVNIRGPEAVARIVEGGYYGHPTPLRGTYVGYGGNPTFFNDGEWEISTYQWGVQPEPAWDPDLNLNLLNFVSSNSLSPDGVIEYMSSNELGGRLLIAYFDEGDRRIDSVEINADGSFGAVEPLLDENGAVISGESTDFRPLDLIADQRGRVYVGGFNDRFGSDGELRLLTPIDPDVVLPGDFVRDGQIDDDDLARWESSLGVDHLADADLDDDSDGADFLAWQRALGGSGGSSPASITVPEPASGLLAILLLFAATSPTWNLSLRRR